jgi:hypothetical protein
MSVSATYTVVVDDVNDNAPVFDRKVYKGKIPETKADEVEEGKQVLLVRNLQIDEYSPK